MYGENVNLHWKSSKFSLALQPKALVNTSGRVDFSSPDVPPEGWGIAGKLTFPYAKPRPVYIESRVCVVKKAVMCSFEY